MKRMDRHSCTYGNHPWRRFEFENQKKTLLKYQQDGYAVRNTPCVSESVRICTLTKKYDM